MPNSNPLDDFSQPAWSLSHAMDTYNVAYWSEGYFSLNEAGEVVVHSSVGNEHQGGSLNSIVERIKEQGLSLPVLVRFPAILRHRVKSLGEAFRKAMEGQQYQASYTSVYPIKVNQQRRVVEEIIAGQSETNRVGLEAGSKPELLAVLALSKPGQSTIVCNGYKDREFVRLALMAEKMGHQVFIVIEKPNELSLVEEEASRLQVTPRVGLRARLSSVGKGNWQNTGGEKAKFGLSASQIVAMVQRLGQQGKSHWVEMLHFHMGSQISQVSDIQKCMTEASRFYVELQQLGAPIQVVDVGGGLGVDYEGTRSTSFCSMNYSLEEYAYQIVHTLKGACDEAQLPYPNIITESGRALTAHHAVLITEVIDSESVGQMEAKQPSDDDPEVIKDLWRNYQRLHQSLKSRDIVGAYHELNHALQECQHLFSHGLVSLTQRSEAENIYYAACVALRKVCRAEVKPHRVILDELNEKLAIKLFLNFSLFQSTPDVWGIEQVFPIIPIVGLNEPPQVRVSIQDITCDSDGRIDCYVDGVGIESTLPLPASAISQATPFGIFMVGAYQEILGDMHNLFGDTHSVNVEFDEEGEVILSNEQFGDSVADVLRYVDFEPDQLQTLIQKQIDGLALEPSLKTQLSKEIEEGLQGYTYFEQ